MAQDDYYNVLEVDKQATEKQIKEAFRKLALKFRPDRNKDNPGAMEQMKKVNEAYAVLSNPAKRREYDTLKSQYGSSAYTRFETIIPSRIYSADRISTTYSRKWPKPSV